MSARAILLAAAASIAVLGGGCGGSDPAGIDPLAEPSGPGPGDGPGDGTGGDAARIALRPLGDRETFFRELRGALVAQRGGGQGEADGSAPGVPMPGAPGAAPPAPTTPASPTDTGSESGGDAAAPGTPAGGDGRLEVTETNVQEQGVDEQDRVKVSADGTRLYVLQSGYGDALPGEPVIVEGGGGAAPVAIGPDIAPDDPYPGTPPPDARTTLRILGLDAAATEATPLRDVEIDLGGRIAQGLYLYEGDEGSDVLLTSTGGAYAWDYWDRSSAFGGLDSVLTRIDVDDPASAAISGSLRLDGQIVSSRRIGKYLFFASRFYPLLPGPQPWELSADAWQAAVEAADAETLLPHYASDGSDATTPLVEPERCFVAPHAADRWTSPDIITLAVVDLETMTLADSECYLGASETLYASPNAVYLATTRWDYGYGGAAPVAEPDTPVGNDDVPPYERPRIETDIHQFDIDGGSIVYRGSGSVRGHLGNDELRKPFRMSEKDGFLRVATVNDAFGEEAGPNVSPISLTVLRPDGDGALARVAELPDADRPAFIGKPGEQLYASRFLGDRAYLVTFRQSDPLYVVDLSDPRAPRVAGELELPGYSDYLLPIGESHLLGIGRDAVEATDGRGEDRGAFVLGVKLSLFDVSDLGAPREVQSLVVGQRGTDANALSDHRGITVQHASDTHPTRVSFGIDVAGEAFPEGQPPPDELLTYHAWRYSGLHGFDVRTGADAGIEARGAMVAERAGVDGYYGPRRYDDRSVMVDDATYYVHGPDVYAAPWDDLANPSGPR